MKILDTRLMPAGMSGIARVDVELDCGARLFNLTIKLGQDGTHRVWAPHAFGRWTATFSPELSAAIAAAALSHLEASNCQHDHRPY
ncbi:hypothetical protein ACO2RV_18670 [Ancylobacter sp. VNQ12]|uniref:hypothetical protein n=1 Tax=Ancylobacter sp. VNQ12 TaxID=3400920 RepID=UPI003BFB0D22